MRAAFLVFATLLLTATAVAAAPEASPRLVDIPTLANASVEFELSLTQEDLLPQISAIIDSAIDGVFGEGEQPQTVQSGKAVLASRLGQVVSEVNAVHVVQQTLKKTPGTALNAEPILSTFEPLAVEAGMRRIVTLNKPFQRISLWMLPYAEASYVVMVNDKDNAAEVWVAAVDGKVDLAALISMAQVEIKDGSFSIGVGASMKKGEESRPTTQAPGAPAGG